MTHDLTATIEAMVAAGERNDAMFRELFNAEEKFDIIRAAFHAQHGTGVRVVPAKSAAAMVIAADRAYADIPHMGDAIDAATAAGDLTRKEG